MNKSFHKKLASDAQHVEEKISVYEHIAADSIKEPINEWIGWWVKWHILQEVWQLNSPVFDEIDVILENES